MDNHCLRIIANPHLLKKNIKQIKNIKINEFNNDEILLNYLIQSDKEIYIHPNLFYKIKNKIDDLILQQIISSTLDELITIIHYKFDT